MRQQIEAFSEALQHGQITPAHYGLDAEVSQCSLLATVHLVLTRAALQGFSAAELLEAIQRQADNSNKPDQQQ